MKKEEYKFNLRFDLSKQADRDLYETIRKRTEYDEKGYRGFKSINTYILHCIAEYEKGIDLKRIVIDALEEFNQEKKSLYGGEANE